MCRYLGTERAEIHLYRRVNRHAAQAPMVELDNDWTNQRQITRCSHKGPVNAKRDEGFEGSTHVENPLRSRSTNDYRANPSLGWTKTEVKGLIRDAAERLWKELHRAGRQQVEPCWGVLLGTLERRGYGGTTAP